MGLVEIFDRIQATKQVEVKQHPNVQPLLDCYPQYPPGSVLDWMMDSVKQASAMDRDCWYSGMKAWRNTFHDNTWASTVYSQLFDYSQEESKRRDFAKAVDMFAGIGSRIILGNKVIANTNGYCSFIGRQ
jgi:hypothetical protein